MPPIVRSANKGDGRDRYSRLCLEPTHASLEKKAPHKGTFGFAIECDGSRILLVLLEETRIEYQREVFCHSTIWSIWRNFFLITITQRGDEQHFLPLPRRVFQLDSSEAQEGRCSSVIAATTPIISQCLCFSLDSCLNWTEVFMLLFLWVLLPNSIVATINNAPLKEALLSSPLPRSASSLAGGGRR